MKKAHRREPGATDILARPDDETCSTTEASELLGVSRTRVMNLLSMGQLDGRKEGGRYVITRRSIYDRIASSVTPPGVESCLYRARFIRELTRPKGSPSRSRWNWHGTLSTYAQHLFGRDQAEPYRAQLHALSVDMLKAGRLREWRRLVRLQDEMSGVWLEYEFVAEPLTRAFQKWVEPTALQVSMFTEEGAA